MPPDASAPPLTIDTDLPCAICNYNLKGLATDSACPECGQPIARTFTPDLTLSPPAWLRRHAVTMFLLAPFALLVFGPSSYRYTFELGALVRLAIIVVTVVAAFRLSAPEVSVVAVDRASDAWRRALLASALAHAIVSITVTAIAISVSATFRTTGDMPGFIYDSWWRLVVGLGTIAYLALTTLFPLYLYRLARRGIDRPLAAHAKLVCWALPGVTVAQYGLPCLRFDHLHESVTMGISDLLNWCVGAASLAYLLLLGRLHETLRAAARVAEAREQSPNPVAL